MSENPLYLDPLAPTFATATGTSSLVAAFNGMRRNIVICNDSPHKVYLAIGPFAAVIGSGVLLNGGGGTFVMSYTEIYCKCPIYAISTGPSSNLSIQEFE
jgi:hypothetical protein